MVSEPVAAAEYAGDAPALLEMVDITKEFPGVKALSNVNLRVRQGRDPRDLR